MMDPEIDLDSTDLTALIESACPVQMPKPATGPKVSTSLRLDVRVMEELQAEAAKRGLGHTVLAQELIEAGLAAMRADQTMVPLADVQRVLAQLARRAGSPAA